ncbi:hypothetical protein GCM10023322_24420 [Rugosimonospora acidiphila]|uniref:Uncharacterized protein n=1 Tax=Rugosimonospora acidiphila TaxID=556531 RepID=A0ABP9RQM3_9ACTN
MYVRLAASWADPSGAVHGAGEFVDVDVVTLAELEEQGVVENAGEEIEEPGYIGPGETEEQDPNFVGPSFVGPSEEGEESDEDEGSDDE